MVEFLVSKEGQLRDVEHNGRTSERFHDAKLPDSSHVDSIPSFSGGHPSWRVVVNV